MSRKKTKTITTEITETYRCVGCGEKFSRVYCKLKGHEYNKTSLPSIPSKCWSCGGDMKFFNREKKRN